MQIMYIFVKMEKIRKILLVTFLLFCCVSCIKDNPEVEFELRVGDSVPTFSVVMNDGTSVNSQQLGQGVALIMFFHTSCPDCRNTLPAVQEIYNRMDKRFPIVLISREQNGDEIAKYWNEMGYTLPYSPQSTREIYNLFATSRVPRVYICNNGIIEHIFTDAPTPTYSDLMGCLNLYFD